MLSNINISIEPIVFTDFCAIAAGLQKYRQIDTLHICLNTEWAKKVSHVNKWQAYNPDGKTVSDHYGISIDLCFD